MTGPGDFELAALEPGFTRDPYPDLARLRAQSPACRVVIQGLPVWLITRYDDVRRGLADPRFSSDPDFAGEPARATPWAAASKSKLSRHLGRADPPEHTRLRRLVAQAFTPRRVEALRPRVRELADELLAGILPRGQADLVADFAQPLPVTVIAELLGVPVADRHEFVRWIDIYVGMNEGDAARIPQAVAAISDYLGALIDSRRRLPPGDTEGGTLLDGLIAARDEGGRLEEDELLAMIFVLMAAGYETIVNLIANGTLALLRNPDQLAALRADPSLLRPAIEELLRYDGPMKLGPALRFATQDVPVGDVVVPAGEPVFFALAAAHRDPARFAEPDRLDIRRPDAGHLAFGNGVHYCLGAPLARMEAEVAFPALLRHCPDLALAADPDRLAWRSSRMMRGLKRLPLTFTPTRSRSGG